MVRFVKVEVKSHRDTGLLVAFSRDLPGLMAQGRSISQLEERLPLLIQQLLDARGEGPVTVSIVRKESNIAAFEFPTFMTSISRAA